MSTTFNFPPNPTLNQQVTLPNGAIAQWNGTEWVSVGDSTVTYPLPITAGGTGATTAGAARINLGLNTATGEFVVQKDGTVALPGIAFASEPGLGWYRNGAGIIQMVAGGAPTFLFNASTATGSEIQVHPRAAGGGTLTLLNNTVASGAYNALQLTANSTEYLINEAGPAAAKRLRMAFSQGVLVTGALTAASPVIVDGTGGVSNGQLSINKHGAGSYAFIQGTKDTVARWQILLGDAVAESGGNTGSHFFIERYSDTGAFLGQPFAINRTNGMVTVSTALQLTGLGNRIEVASSTSTPSGPGGQSLLMQVDSGLGWAGAYSMQNGSTTGVVAWSWNITNPGGINGFEFRQTGSTTKWSGPTTWDLISDISTKENIKPYTTGLAEILQLVPKTFTRIRHRDMDPKFKPPEEVGLIAQDVEPIIPRCVSQFDATTKMMNIDPILFAFINAFKTLDQRLKSIGA